MTTNDIGATYAPSSYIQRADALRLAAEVLTVKSGKYADRPLDADEVIKVAAFLLDVNVLPKSGTVNVSIVPQTIGAAAARAVREGLRKGAGLKPFVVDSDGNIERGTD